MDTKTTLKGQAVSGLPEDSCTKGTISLMHHPDQPPQSDYNEDSLTPSSLKNKVRIQMLLPSRQPHRAPMGQETRPSSFPKAALPKGQMGPTGSLGSSFFS